MQKDRLRKVLFSLLALTIVALSAVVFFATDTNLSEITNIGNVYVLAFVISIISGLSFFTPISLGVFSVELSNLNANTGLLTVILTSGISLIDIIVFSLMLKGRDFVSEERKVSINTFSDEVKDKLSGIKLFFLIYGYAALAPFPNEFMFFFLTIVKHSLKKTLIPLLLGNLTYVFLIIIGFKYILPV